MAARLAVGLRGGRGGGAPASRNHLAVLHAVGAGSRARDQLSEVSGAGGGFAAAVRAFVARVVGPAAADWPRRAAARGGADRDGGRTKDSRGIYARGFSRANRWGRGGVSGRGERRGRGGVREPGAADGGFAGALRGSRDGARNEGKPRVPGGAETRGAALGPVTTSPKAARAPVHRGRTRSDRAKISSASPASRNTVAGHRRIDLAFGEGLVFEVDLDAEGIGVLAGCGRRLGRRHARIAARAAGSDSHAAGRVNSTAAAVRAATAFIADVGAGVDVHGAIGDGRVGSGGLMLVQLGRDGAGADRARSGPLGRHAQDEIAGCDLNVLRGIGVNADFDDEIAEFIEVGRELLARLLGREHRDANRGGRAVLMVRVIGGVRTGPDAALSIGEHRAGGERNQNPLFHAAPPSQRL